VVLDSTDLELVNDSASGAGDQIVGLRFENMNLPAGTIISDAYVQFSADEAQSETTVLSLHAQAADNATVFSTNLNNLSSRPLTSATVSWTPAAWDTIGERGPLQRTPDLTPLVREVASRPGWNSGNAMAFLISGTGRRTADSADKPGGLPATLTVNYWPELPVGSYDRWAASHPNSSAPDENPDGDNYKNLLEFALGLDPSLPEHGATPLTFDNSSLYLTYTRPSAVTDVSYRVEWANTVDSTIWITTGVTQQIISDDGARRTIRATVPKGAGLQRFVRLKVTR
jgi:hypothetical protein